MVRHRHDITRSGFRDFPAKLFPGVFGSTRGSRHLVFLIPFGRKERHIRFRAIHRGCVFQSVFGQFAVRLFPTLTKERGNCPRDTIPGSAVLGIYIVPMERFIVRRYFQLCHNILF